MRVVVCVPWRPSGDRRRTTNWGYVRGWWGKHFPWSVTTAPGPEGLFNRSAARNAAAAGEWDVAVFADADTICRDPGQVYAAVTIAQDGALTYPFDRFEGLNQGQTDKLLRGGNPGRGAGKPQPSPGGILAVNRDLFERVGGYDEAFTGWGYEDVAFAIACRTFGGEVRVEGSILHLWHPPAKEKRDAIHFRTPNRARRERYGSADGDPEAMTRLLEELRG